LVRSNDPTETKTCSIPTTYETIINDRDYRVGFDSNNPRFKSDAKNVPGPGQ